MWFGDFVSPVVRMVGCRKHAGQDICVFCGMTWEGIVGWHDLMFPMYGPHIQNRISLGILVQWPDYIPRLWLPVLYREIINLSGSSICFIYLPCGSSVVWECNVLDSFVAKVWLMMNVTCDDKLLSIRPGARMGVTCVLFAKRFPGIFWKGNVSTLWKPISYKNLKVRKVKI